MTHQLHHLIPEWKAEKSFLEKQKRAIERRLAELEDILRAFAR